MTRKNEDNLNNEDDLKHEDFKNEETLKNYDNLENEDDAKIDKVKSMFPIRKLNHCIDIRKINKY